MTSSWPSVVPQDGGASAWFLRKLQIHDINEIYWNVINYDLMGGGNSNIFLWTNPNLGRFDPIGRACFSNGWWKTTNGAMMIFASKSYGPRFQQKCSKVDRTEVLVVSSGAGLKSLGESGKPSIWSIQKGVKFLEKKDVLVAICLEDFDSSIDISEISEVCWSQVALSTASTSPTLSSWCRARPALAPLATLVTRWAVATSIACIHWYPTTNGLSLNYGCIPWWFSHEFHHHSHGVLHRRLFHRAFGSGVKMADHLQRLVVAGRLNAGFCPFTGQRQTTLGGAEVSRVPVELAKIFMTGRRVFFWVKKDIFFQNIMHNWASVMNDFLLKIHVNTEPKWSKRDSSIVDEIFQYTESYSELVTSRCLASFFKMHNMLVFLSWSSIVPTSHVTKSPRSRWVLSLPYWSASPSRCERDVVELHKDLISHVYNTCNIVVYIINLYGFTYNIYIYMKYYIATSISCWQFVITRWIPRTLLESSIPFVGMEWVVIQNRPDLACC